LNTFLSRRVNQIKPSATLSIMATANALKAQGIDVINLSTGEPDFDTPEPIKTAAKIAIDAGFTKYTAVEGILDLRKAIAQKFLNENQLQYEVNQIIVSSGAKQGFFNLCQAILNPGDEVIIPAPYWVSYPDIVLVNDATPVIITTDLAQNFKITPEQLENAISPKTKLFVINSPSNPTGVAYTRSELEALAKVLLKHPHVLIASDDIYEHIWWRTEPFYNIVMVAKDLYPRTIIIHGVSKTYAMTGWRIGFSAGPREIITAMGTIQSQSTSNPCSIAQKAALAALTGDQDCLKPMIAAFKARSTYVTAALNAIEGIECEAVEGAFYAFPKVEAVIKRLGLANDVTFSEFLLNRARVAVVPGAAFGAPGYIRLSVATSLENLQEGIKRIGVAVGG